MTVPLSGKEIQALIATADVEIAKVKHSNTLTIEAKWMDLQKLEAVRHSLMRDLIR
jgi:hypothetical protein